MIYTIEPTALEQVVDSLHNNDYCVVLAHPENLEAVHSDPNVLIPLVERGVAMQITAADLAGFNGIRKQYLCQDLILHGMGHLIASDAHAAIGPRAPAMQAGYKAAVRLVGPHAYHLFVTIPQLVLDEKPLPKFKPRPVTRRRG
jgi:protein-tyrosine phosphatase